MRLLVPTNWDPELIEPLSSLDAVEEMYGAMPLAVASGGRSGSSLPRVTPEEVEEYVKQVHAKGLKFDYPLNASCLGNMEWNEDFHRELLEQLDWLDTIGVDTITVAIPYLLELIREQFPRFGLRVSTVDFVNTVAKAKFFESMGADSITIDFDANRDFGMLRELKNAVRCELVLLLNNVCLYQCPSKYHHYNCVSHSNQPYSPVESSYMEYHLIRCASERYSDLSHFIKSRWIRPEDLAIYEEMGFNTFKVGGRSMSTEWITQTTTAYSSRQYNGNLCDLLQIADLATKHTNPLAPLSRIVKMGSRLARHKGLIRTFGSFPDLPHHLKLMEMESFGTLLRTQPPEIYVDNHALNGFLSFFNTQDCDLECAHCNYCQKKADEVIRLDRRQVDEYISILNDVLHVLHSRGLT